jgi:hypothetical protein
MNNISGSDRQIQSTTLSLQTDQTSLGRPSLTEVTIFIYLQFSKENIMSFDIFR